MFGHGNEHQRYSSGPRAGRTNITAEQVRAHLRVASPPTILVAEDDADMRAMLVTVLQRKGYQIQECKDGWDLLAYLKHYIIPTPNHQNLDLIISDIRMPGVTGLEMLTVAESSPGFPPVILITAFGDERTHAVASRKGAIAVFDKPFEIDVLLAKVHEVVPWPR
jgi:CheY-like chemotaxis protein